VRQHGNPDPRRPDDAANRRQDHLRGKTATRRLVSRQYRPQPRMRPSTTAATRPATPTTARRARALTLWGTSSSTPQAADGDRCAATPRADGIPDHPDTMTGRLRLRRRRCWGPERPTLVFPIAATRPSPPAVLPLSARSRPASDHLACSPSPSSAGEPEAAAVPGQPRQFARPW
jgi:hypothetical protein